MALEGRQDWLGWAVSRAGESEPLPIISLHERVVLLALGGAEGEHGVPKGGARGTADGNIIPVVRSLRAMWRRKDSPGKSVGIVSARDFSVPIASAP